jgi:pyridoxine kinase
MFRREVVPLADIITPNQFELEALTGIKTASLDGVVEAIGALHKAGPGVVLVTSYRRGRLSGALDDPANPSAPESPDAEAPANSEAPNPGKAGDFAGDIEMLVSNGKEIYSVRTPELYFENGSSMAGSGDLTTAVFLSRYLETGDICRTLELTAASVYGIIHATHAAGSREILIVAAQEELVHPSQNFAVCKL